MLPPKRCLYSLGLFFVFLFTTPGISAAEYQVNQLPSAEWQNTKADRLQPEVSGLYQFDYGEDATLTFDLPWAFPFYGTDYTELTADTDGNIWFSAPGEGPQGSRCFQDKAAARGRQTRERLLCLDRLPPCVGLLFFLRRSINRYRSVQRHQSRIDGPVNGGGD